MSIPKDAFGRDFPLEDALQCVGPGWSRLIDALWNICNAGDVSIHQIKEKFGGLRFYVGAAPEIVHNTIENLEAESFKICELCGETGELRISLSWHKTLCNLHYSLAVNDEKAYKKLIWALGEKHKSELSHLFSPEALEEIRERFKKK